jgi:chemotaxis protein CheX
MNVKFMNPFVEAVSEVLQAECDLTSTRGNISLQKLALTADDVTVMISLIGQVQGVVLYGLSIKTALGMVSQVMGQEFTEFDSLAQSGIAELGNVITGRATIKMSQAGFVANISPPTLIVGKGVTISTLDFARILVPITTDVGTVTVHLALRESPPGLDEHNFINVQLPAGLGKSR